MHKIKNTLTDKCIFSERELGEILLNVLVLTNEFEEESFGGAGTAATGIVYMLDRMGIRQTVIVPRSDWNEPRWFTRGKQIKVLGLPRNPRYFGYLGVARSSVLRQEFPELWQKWDLIHIQAINFAALADTLANSNLPILYSVYSFLREELGDRKDPGLQAQFKAQEELLKKCQKIHLVSQSQKSYLSNHFPEYLSKAEVLSLGITLPEESWNQENINQFLYLGRLMDYKGVEDLIKAIEIVSLSGRLIYLDIVGKGPDLYEKYLKRLVQLMNLETHIQFYGWRTTAEVQHWMTKAAGLVIPSWREAFGFVALEGMALGTPLIVSRAGGLKELVSDEYALTFEAGNVDELSKALIMALDHPSLLNPFSVKARQQAVNYEWTRLGSRYLTFLEQVERRI